MRQTNFFATALVASSLFMSSAAWASSNNLADKAINCHNCAKWNAPHAPFQIFGNSYFVGVADISSVLITSKRGHILIDGGLPQSAPLIIANIKALGFRIQDVRLIVNAHAHFDHAGGIHYLQKMSGANVAASTLGAAAIMAGLPPISDPQFAYGADNNRFPATPRVAAVKDAATLTVGDLKITAQYTPGHTPGGTSWIWQSCEKERCLHMVFADSLNSVSAPEFRFSGDATHPGIADEFKRSIAKVAALPCDIMLAAHPSFTKMDAMLAARLPKKNADALVDQNACKDYAAAALLRLEKRLQEEAQSAP
jgi:metallo-beta-lactamase class B